MLILNMHPRMFITHVHIRSPYLQFSFPARFTHRLTPLTCTPAHLDSACSLSLNFLFFGKNISCDIGLAFHVFSSNPKNPPTPPPPRRLSFSFANNHPRQAAIAPGRSSPVNACASQGFRSEASLTDESLNDDDGDEVAGMASRTSALRRSRLPFAILMANFSKTREDKKKDDKKDYYLTLDLVQTECVLY